MIIINRHNMSILLDIINSKKEIFLKSEHFPYFRKAIITGFFYRDIREGKLTLYKENASPFFSIESFFNETNFQIYDSKEEAIKGDPL